MYYEKLGGRKYFAWQVITILSFVLLFLGKISDSDWVTVTLGSMGLTSAANVLQKIYRQKSKSKAGVSNSGKN